MGVVLLAALLLLALAIYVAVGRKPASEELRENDQTEDDDAEPWLTIRIRSWNDSVCQNEGTYPIAPADS
jgi:hypothetical protein